MPVGPASSSKCSWTFTFSSPGGQRLADPPGFRALTEKSLDDEVSKAPEQTRSLRSDDGVSVETRRANQRALDSITRSAWELSWLPAKSLGMNLVMLYFAGSSGNIFTVLIIGYALVNAVTTLLRVNTVFVPIEKALLQNQVDTTSSGPHHSSCSARETQGDSRSSKRILFPVQKAVFVLVALAITSYTVYHAGKLGILPLNPSHYVSHPPVKVAPTLPVINLTPPTV